MARASETVRPLAHDLHAHEPVGEKRRTGPSVRATAIGTDRADQDRSILDRFHFGEGSSRRNGSFKKNGPQAIGKSRGGWNAKIHMVAADDRTAIAFALSPGNDHGVPAYNGVLFSSEQHPFLTEKSLSDKDVALIIDKLSRTKDPLNRDAGSFRVDYRDLAIRQLGFVYEGLLEMRPRYAKERLVVIRSTSAGSNVERFHPVAEPVPNGFRHTDQIIPRGTVYLETDKGERRLTGSYYTPDHVVNYIVEKSLGALCGRINESIQSQIDRVESEMQAASEAEMYALQ